MSSEDSLIVSLDGAPSSRQTRPKFLQSVKRKISYGSTKRSQSTLRSNQQNGRFQDSYVAEMEPPTPTSEQRRQLDEQPKKSSCKAKFASFCFTFIVFLFVLVSAALSKVCFANIAAQLNANSSVGNGSDGGKRRSIAFVQLVLVLCVPQVVTILKTLFLGILGKTTKRFPWPTWKALLKGVLVAIAEAFCLSVFTMFVATQADPATTILLIPGVFAFTALSSMCSERVRRIIRPCCRAPNGRNTGRGNDEDSTQSSIWMKRIATVLDSEVAKSFGFFLQIVGLLGAVIALLVYLVMDKYLATIYILLSIPVCGITLSFLWSSMVQSAIFKAEQQQQQRTDQDPEGHPTYPASYKGGCFDLEVFDNCLQELSKQLAKTSESKRPASFVYACCRLLLIPFICWGLAYSLRLSTDINVADGFTDWKPHDHLVFFLQVFGALCTVFFSLIALWSTFQPWAFTLPLLLSTPTAVIWFWIQHSLSLHNFPSESLFPFGDLYPSAYYISYLSGHWELSGIVGGILACLWVGEIFCLGAQIWTRPRIPVARENTLYLSPAYDSVFLDSFLLLNRLSAQSLNLQSTQLKNVAEQSRTSTVFICSTMFREAEHEMQQMLKSIHRVAQLAASQEQSDIAKFESHIFFDGAVSSNQFQEFSLQLISLLEKALKVELGNMRKYKTPYGYQMHWMVENTLPFYIHLKDNTKVKNKKRWSQVMYMSYILEHRLKEKDEEGRLKHDPDSTYILTTDADIDFTPDSVAALLDFLVRDDSVGAVCARTHPLGSGLLVWYQIFEYALGHWLQKSAEHLLGCVLCCPGCFSVFRVSAIADVVKTYQSSVTSASEFLTKDMGEDRWLCTLLIQKGWRLEYAALPQNSTYCPESFNEFFNQRRRWVPSTLANLIELITSSGQVTSVNDSISYFFIFYQIIIIFSTAISPATIILLIASGLATTSLNISGIVTIVILSAVTLFYVVICLWTPEKIQLLVGKLLAFFMAVVMFVAFAGVLVDAVGTVIQLSKVAGNQTQVNAFLEREGIPLDAAYLLGFAVIVILAGLMHGYEFKALLHSVLYILCIPTAYVLLIIYAVCNLHNRSWGTRVGITVTSGSDSKLVAVYNDVMGVLFDLWGAFVACLRRKKRKDTPPDTPPTTTPEGDVEAGRHEDRDCVEHVDMQEDLRHWLEHDMDCCQDYIMKFEENGYTRFEFLEGMSMKDLKEIGIDRRGYQLRLFRAIQKNPKIPKWQEKGIPTDVANFLKSLELAEYTHLFRREGYRTLDDVENLIGLTESHLKQMGITKKAHLNQLMKGLKRLQYPTYRDRKIRCAKYEVEKAVTIPLEELHDKKDELDFWVRMVDPKKGILRPESAQFDGNTDDLKEKLKALRNSAVAGLVFVNILWMALIVLIRNLGDLLEMVNLKDGPISSIYLVSYFIIIILQFGALFIHRMETLLHVVARNNAPHRVRGHWFNPMATVVIESDEHS